MNKESRLVTTLSYLNNRATKHIDAHLSLHGISFSEYLVLSHLAKSPNLQSRRSDVATSVALSPSGVTRMLAPMEKIGLVTKEKAKRDARVSLVRITNAGQCILNDAELTMDQAATSLFDNLSNVQRNTLHELLQKML